ncbi:hypothetical protein DFS34DRAFT_602992 [Phlyctochytrium arcticum]|nr:hypothetical protein DFS34DRAFT_602992 [Phlyctochytrium arcticum]
MAAQTYLVTVLRFIQKWYLSLPLATGFLVFQAVASTLGNKFIASPPSPGFCPTQLGVDPWYHFIPSLLASSAVHLSFATLFLNMLFFPPLLAVLERQRGTLHALQFGFVLGPVCAILYGLVAYPLARMGVGLSAGEHAWCVGGMNSIMYALIAVEANAKAGVFKTRRIFGIPLPGAMYPWLLLVLSWWFFSGSPFIFNMVGIFAGILYHLGALDFLILADKWQIKLERTRPFQMLARWDAFIPTPSSVQLPTMNSPTGELGLGQDGQSGIGGRVRNWLGQSRGTYSRL